MSADTPAPAPRKKRMTVFDALDGALAKVKGLDEAAARAKTLPFKLRSETADQYEKSHEKKVYTQIKEQDKRVEQESRTEEQDKRAPKQSSSEPSRSYVPVLLDSPAAARTPAQRRVLNYFETHGSHVSNYDKIITETGLPYNTVRKGINKLIAAGCLSKTRWSQGSSRGLLFTYHGQTGQFNRAEQQGSSIGKDEGAGQKSRTIRQSKGAPFL